MVNLRDVNLFCAPPSVMCVMLKNCQGEREGGERRMRSTNFVNAPDDL